MLYYPFDNRIHNLGNIGFGGKVHAEIAQSITKNIDNKRYNGRNIRQEINNYINSKYNNPKILDLCCGIGISTSQYGIDTSTNFIEKAKKLYPNKIFKVDNAETYIPNEKIDVVTCMFSFHEMPEYAHNLIIKNSLKIAQKEVIILDISTNYKPSYFMLLGEPYLINYMKTIDKTMNKYNFNKINYINNHVNFWNFIK
jgi:trans-aconitate methyltransferase